MELASAKSSFLSAWQLAWAKLSWATSLILPKAAAIYTVGIYFSTPQCWLFTLYLLFCEDVLIRLLVAGYLAWIFVGPGRDAAKNVTWRPYMRRWGLWNYLAAYFRAELVKTAELDPSKSYLFGVHPHGVLTMASWINFSTESTGFSDKFPGIEMHVGTLNWNFVTPIAREFLLMHGACDVTRDTLCALLSRPGRAVMVAIGGAAEALHAFPGTYDLVLAKRKGFVKVAMMTGASLVPVLCFGENEVMTTVKVEHGSFTHKLQRFLKGIVGFTIPVCYGRGLFGIRYGILPNPVRHVTVVGAPIDIPKFTGDLHSEEGQAAVNRAHAKYIAALQALWEQHKDQYAKQRRSSLHIIE
uniref:Acyltransferase n=1 Tax=Lobosphaera incisa TaxID=312850 RepID=A0A386RU68_9CHLO|nr:DGAT2B [Lobosphaera incisa]AZI70897.1 acyl-CoA:diacylglycerol acyltransferase 2.1 [Lobosphaera incisa]